MHASVVAALPSPATPGPNGTSVPRPGCSARRSISPSATNATARPGWWSGCRSAGPLGAAPIARRPGTPGRWSSRGGASPVAGAGLSPGFAWRPGPGQDAGTIRARTPGLSGPDAGTIRARRRDYPGQTPGLSGPDAGTIRSHRAATARRPSRRRLPSGFPTGRTCRHGRHPYWS